MKKQIMAGILALLLLIPGMSLSACSRPPEKYSAYSFDYFDTVTTVTGYAPSQEAFDEVTAEIFRLLGEYHKLYTIYHRYEGMENLCTVNELVEGQHRTVTVDRRIIDLLLYAKEMHDRTDGRVNIAMGSVLSLWHTYRTQGSNDPASSTLPPMDKLRDAANHTDIQNMVIDEAATETARQAARNSVEPVIYKQGQNIVREGERISSYQIAMLSALGLLDTASIDLTVYGGAALIVAATVILMVIMLQMLNPDVLQDLRQVLVIMLVMLISVGLGVISVKLINVYLVPVALGAMLLTGLLGARTGLTAGIALSIILAGIAAGSNNTYSAEMVHLLLTGVVGSVVAVKFLAGKPQRVRTVICGVLVAGVNLVMLLAQGLMTASDLHNTMSNAFWSMAGGVISGLIAVGFQPVFEAAFNLATPSKLLELANPNQPLLRRLLMEAPGTYHHSIIVANLSEAAAERIGANPLLARTGAYFHDIGKLKRPLYFKENQRGENPHDHTDAYVSAAIVTAHTSDGLVLAQKHHLPPEIQRIIVEHHGDTPVMYFYHKALQQADGKPVDIKDFRYGGNRPSTKESAIVMLADTIEAAVRSMSDPTPQAIQRFIERLVRGKIEDGQLSNSPLSLLDIDGICEAFSAVLSGVFHERIEYPSVQMGANGAPAAAPAKPAGATTGATPVVKPVAQTTGSVPVVKPVAQTTGATPVVKPAAQTTGSTPVVKPVAQTTGSTPAMKPVPQTTGSVPVVAAEKPAVKPMEEIDAIPEPFNAPLPDGEAPAQKEDTKE